jgi:hypothetical protein
VTAPPSASAVIARSLAKDVRQRFQSVEDFARALAPFGSGRVRRRSHASFDEVARTWLAWPPLRKSIASASAAASAVRSGRRPGALSRRARIVAAVGTCFVVIPAITFAGGGFNRDGARASDPPRCVDTSRVAGAVPLESELAEPSPVTVPSPKQSPSARGTPSSAATAHDRRAPAPAPSTPVSTKPGARTPTLAADDPLYL